MWNSHSQSTGYNLHDKEDHHPDVSHKKHAGLGVKGR